MSRTPITAAMRRLLDALAAWPDVDTEALRRCSEWAQASAWGWVMESGELTGIALAHVKELPGGILSWVKENAPQSTFLRRIIGHGALLCGPRPKRHMVPSPRAEAIVGATLQNAMRSMTSRLTRSRVLAGGPSGLGVSFGVMLGTERHHR